ncbi:hypothetical protein JXO59_14665 [candidate division KSB1 bacterium]|nr:hypothetical protein [candidate division KSB1 bacterium]
MEPSYEELAHLSLCGMQPLLARYPSGFCQWLIALDYALFGRQEVAIVGDIGAPDTRDLLRVCRQAYHPHRIVAVDDGGNNIPLLRGRTRLDGRAIAHVCTGYTCHAIITDPQELAEALAGAT